MSLFVTHAIALRTRYVLGQPGGCYLNCDPPVSNLLHKTRSKEIIALASASSLITG
ncbi:hypothetical protein [Cylindrospermopsis sp. CR12]|uniref:hypothetical protein n=1 Tax=Cylindrospermopsis sp. CR12 TaxID=1747196 RepID=UPI00137AE772|nr:hypothetical protein [Cylindrospermopsis sp. CR12]MBU6346252.1 hypothetical protein [Cyanobacteria bacterium REEB494]